MSAPPKCTSLGPQCHAIDVTVLIDDYDDDDAPTGLDSNATWLMGHTEQITFRDLRRVEDELLVEATLHVPCKFLKANGAGVTCKAHGFAGRNPSQPKRVAQPRQLGGDRFKIVEAGKMVTRRLAAPRQSLPIMQDNPCEGAPCRTADNKHGGACCRDLQMEILCRSGQSHLEALIRSRKAPYLCKVEREGEASLEVEVITACGYLEEGSVACSLHGRKRKDASSAKPQLCYDWPPKRGPVHPGCAFRGRGKRKTGS